MRRTVIIAAVVSALVTVPAAEAQQTEAYFYDVHGRLQAAAKAPTVGGSTTLSMQTGGNLTVRGPENELIWQSGTAGIPGARFVVQDDGNLVIYSGWTAIWHSGACCY